MDAVEETWRPPPQTHGVLMFSGIEARRLIVSTKLRLRGHASLPTGDWLPEPELCFVDGAKI